MNLKNINKDITYKCMWKVPMEKWIETATEEAKGMTPYARECKICQGYNPACDRYNPGRKKEDITGTKVIVDALGGNYLK